MNVVVISCSLNPRSRSRRLARAAADMLGERGISVRWIDLQEENLPFCHGGGLEPGAMDPSIAESIRGADGVLMGVPIYNYDVNAAAKNLIELTGRAWQDQVVGFLCAAGGRGSYMSVMGLANSLMLDFRCLVLPRFVYADGSGFEGDAIQPTILERIEGLVGDLAEIGGAVAQVRAARASR